MIVPTGITTTHANNMVTICMTSHTLCSSYSK